MEPDAMISVFWMLSFKPAFSLSFFSSSKGSLVSFRFLPLEWYLLISETTKFILWEWELCFWSPNQLQNWSEQKARLLFLLDLLKAEFKFQGGKKTKYGEIDQVCYLSRLDVQGEYIYSTEGSWVSEFWFIKHSRMWDSGMMHKKRSVWIEAVMGWVQCSQAKHRGRRQKGWSEGGKSPHFVPWHLSRGTSRSPEFSQIIMTSFPFHSE